MSRLTRDGMAEPVSRDQILRCETGCSADLYGLCDHDQDWQPYPVDLNYVVVVCTTNINTSYACNVYTVCLAAAEWWFTCFLAACFLLHSLLV